ncbi:ABC transporter permease [Terracoccus sp. 273MFTsu3.1]|uniref:ABC transporter permease n=1 Tax=Terracoccus sp. 273MFTsu3.1 TaxID=1172188 RepID=UPI00036FCB30|nr:ABC transporter permease [Terracoccus sp. 273MFTsu3.1]
MTTLQHRPDPDTTGESVRGAEAGLTDEPSSGGGRPWLIVAVREVVVRVTNRTFLFSTLFTLVFIAGFAAFSAWQAGKTTTYTVAVSSAEGTRLVEHAASTARSTSDTVVITPTTVAGEDAAHAAVDRGEVDAWLHQTSAGWTVTSGDDVAASLRTPLEGAVRDAALDRNAAAAGTTVEALERGATLVADRFDGQTTNRGFVQAATFAFALLFFMGALMFGQQIAASVVEEKQSRLVEIIATAIPLRALLAGKVVGNAVIAMAQVVLFAGVGLVAVSFTEWSSLLPALSTAVVWFVLFFAVGFFALACLFAVAGALASRTEDLQSTTSPLTTLLMLVYFASFALTGTPLKVASFVPIVSVVAMPGRIIAGDAAWWEPVVALLLMAAFSAVTVVIGEKVYRRSLMQTRGRMSWKQALRTAD